MKYFIKSGIIDTSEKIKKLYINKVLMQLVYNSAHSVFKKLPDAFYCLQLSERKEYMVRHIVVWRIADGENKQERAEAIKENLEALKDKIDELVDIEVGLNFNETESASDVVLVSTFRSKEDLEIYQNHPEHKAVGANYVRPYVKERRVVDYEF